jgi:hypothetical protein
MLSSQDKIDVAISMHHKAFDCREKRNFFLETSKTLLPISILKESKKN